MHYLKRMHKPQSYDDLLCDFGSIILGKEFLSVDKVKKVDTLHQLSYYVNVRSSLHALFKLEQ
jgi:hypothetical protein